MHELIFWDALYVNTLVCSSLTYTVHDMRYNGGIHGGLSLFLGWSKTKAGHKSRDLHELKWSWRYKASKYLNVEIADTCNTVEPLPMATNVHLSTTAPHYNSYSFHTFINWLLFKPLYNDHFLLSPRWPLINVIQYYTSSYSFQTSMQCNPLNPYFADEVEIKFNENKAWLVNNEYNTQPLVAHGNGPSKVVTNKNTNYWYNFPSSYPCKILTEELVKTLMIWLVWVCGKESWCWFALFKLDLCFESPAGRK